VLPPSDENDDDLSNDSLLEEVDLFLASDNSIPPGNENIADDPEGDIRFLEELLIDDSILSYERRNSAVMNDKDENIDYSSFIFFMFDKVFSLLSAESEDTIFDHEEVDLFLASDNSIPPGNENIADDPEGDIRFLEELLIDDSILSYESFDSNFEDNPSIPRPHP
nr:hypothetical protein [Tanacetum cinerariifolium]